MTESFIALDVHATFSEMAVVTGSGRYVRRIAARTSASTQRWGAESVNNTTNVCT